MAVELKVAIVASHCSLRLGGEPALAFHIFHGLRGRGIAAHLVTHARCERELRAAFPGDHERLHFVADTRLDRTLNGIGRLLPPRVDLWTLNVVEQAGTQLRLRGVLERLVRAGEVNVVHQPHPVSPRFPSWMHDLGVPVVIGPMNGGMEYPPALVSREGALERLITRMGRRASELANQLVPGKRRAAALLVANERTRAALPGGLCPRVVELPENAVDETLWRPRRRANPARPGPFAFVGRLVDWKAVDLLLEAFAAVRARAPEARLLVIGEGPERPALERLARELELLPGAASFTGWQSQPACARLLARSQALVLPSLFECGGAVVLEAMAMGLPVIATRWGGPRDYVDASCGILIPPTSRGELVHGFAQAMLHLHRDPALRARMGAAGRARVAERFTWARKIEAFLTVYREALGEPASSLPADPAARTACVGWLAAASA